MPEVIEFYRMAGDVDYVLRVVVADIRSYDLFYKKLIGAVALKNVASRFAMEKIKSMAALPFHPSRRRSRRLDFNLEFVRVTARLSMPHR
jgi:Lrp/AsnC family transcriptional regulator